MLTPILDDATLQFIAGQTMTATQVIDLILPMAKKYKGQP